MLSILGLLSFSALQHQESIRTNFHYQPLIGVCALRRFSPWVGLQFSDYEGGDDEADEEGGEEDGDGLTASHSEV